jgi:hypothetical protein
LVHRPTIQAELLAWECKCKRSGDCLSMFKETDNLMGFAVDTILAMRQKACGYASHSVRAYIRDCLSSLLRKTPSTLQYVVAGVQTCKATWNWAHGFAAVTSNRVHAEFNQWWRTANVQQTTISETNTNISGVTHTADLWLYRWLLLVTHNPPNGNRASVPKVGAASLFPQYVAWCKGAQQYPTTEDAFRGRLSIVKRDMCVATRKSKQASAECDVCSVLKRAEARCTSLQQKSAIRHLHAEHLKFTNGEVAFYEDHIFQAKDSDQVLHA